MCLAFQRVRPTWYLAKPHQWRTWKQFPITHLLHLASESEKNLNRTKRLWKMCLKLLCLSMAVEGSIARLPNIWRQFLINTFSCSLTPYLHPNYGIDKEEDTHEETHIGQRLSKEMSLRKSCNHFRTSPWKTGQRCRGEFWRWHFCEAVWWVAPPEIVWENRSWPVGSRRWCSPPLWWSQRCSTTHGNSSERKFNHITASLKLKLLNWKANPANFCTTSPLLSFNLPFPFPPELDEKKHFHWNSFPNEKRILRGLRRLILN